MALTPTLSAVAAVANYNSIAFDVPYADDDGNDVIATTIDMTPISATAQADAGATSITVSAIPVTLIANSLITFWNGVQVRLTDEAAKGATSLTVAATSRVIPSGTKAFMSNVQFKKASATNWELFVPMWKTPISSVLNATITTGATSLTVESNTGNLWQAGGVPFDIYVEDERMTVSAVSGKVFTISARGVAGTTAAAHTAGVDMALVGGGHQKDLWGAIFPLDAGTEYNVRLLITTGADEQVVTFSATTRTEPGAIGATTHYVNVRTGSDSNNGTSSGTPWKTLTKAVAVANAAVAPMIIEVEGGYYPHVTTFISQTTHRITFKAATSSTCTYAVDADHLLQTPAGFSPTLTNPGHPLIYDRYAAPTGSGDGAAVYADGYQGEGGWTSATIGGTTLWYRDMRDTAGAYDDTEVCHVTYIPVSGVDYAGAKASAAVRRLGKWADDTEVGSPNLSTVTGFGEMVRTNLSYNAGAYQDLDGAGTGGSNTSPSRLFVRMPLDTDPNDYYWYFGDGTRSADDDTFGLCVNSAPTGEDQGHRLAGLRARTLACGFRLDAGASKALVEYCVSDTCGTGGLVRGDTSAGTTTEIIGATWQFNRFVDSDLWTTDVANDRRITWHGIKQAMVLSDNSDYSANRVLFLANSHGIWLYRNQSSTVIRDCYLEGVFNGVPTGAAQIDNGDNYNTDVYRCTGKYVADNFLEPAGVSINFKAWSNVLTESGNFIETDTSYGPIYLAFNTGHEIANHGITDDGHPTAPEIGSGSVVKYGAPRPPRPRIWFIHNTFWTSKNNPVATAEAKGFVSGVAALHMESFALLNNVWRGKGTITTFRQNGIWLLDESNFYGTSTLGVEFDGRAFKQPGTTGVQTLDEWRKWNMLTNSNGGTVLRGSRTNQLGGTDYAFMTTGQTAIDLALTDGPGGDFTPAPGLAATASFIDAAVPVPGFDLPYVSGDITIRHFAGLAPDLGAIEVNNLPPIAPAQPGRGSAGGRGAKTGRTAATGRVART